jgi:hypothetical protein
VQINSNLKTNFAKVSGYNEKVLATSHLQLKPVLNNDCVSFTGKGIYFVDPREIPAMVDTFAKKLAILADKQGLNPQSVKRAIKEVSPEIDIKVFNISELPVKNKNVSNTRSNTLLINGQDGKLNFEMYINFDLAKDLGNLMYKANQIKNISHEFTHVLQAMTEWKQTISNHFEPNENIAYSTFEDYIGNSTYNNQSVIKKWHNKIEEIGQQELLSFNGFESQEKLKEFFDSSLSRVFAEYKGKINEESALISFWLHAKDEKQAYELEQREFKNVYDYKVHYNFELIALLYENLEHYLAEKIDKKLLKQYLGEYLDRLSPTDRERFQKEIIGFEI